jgi:hypothetical protein
MNLYCLTFLFLVFSFLFSCGNDIADSERENLKTDSLTVDAIITKGEAKIIEPVSDNEIVVLEKDGITLTEIKSESNKDANIELATKQFKEGDNNLGFSVNGIENYTISIIENNYTISHHDTKSIEKEFFYGNNVFLAFLSHANGISIKTNKANVLKNVTFSDESLFDMNQPHLFYYLPQTETNEPILDFYLVNTSISENGNKVKVNINEVEFIINKWAAYKISGLKKQDNSIRIQLIDKNGNLIEGPFNDSGDRSFNLANS